MPADGMTPGGAFVISLDFELHWGVRHRVAVDDYRENLAGVREVVPRLLRLFSAYGVHATWATVGFLFLSGRDELLRSVPARIPRYADRRRCPYDHLAEAGPDERSDPFHFAPSLIELIAATPGQELGTHTFSHYFCLAPGQTVEDFREDLAAAIAVTHRKVGRRPVSLVFPCNQTNGEYLATCRELGIRAYRGNERAWPYRPLPAGPITGPLQRALRFVDSYVDLFGAHTHALAPTASWPVDVPSSRFLRPFSPSLRLLEPLRCRRITSAMTHAARSDEVFHLWWHPHNFGARQDENLAFLERILNHFAALRRRYGMRSVSMGEAARICAIAAGEREEVAHG